MRRRTGQAVAAGLVSAVAGVVWALAGANVAWAQYPPGPTTTSTTTSTVPGTTTTTAPGATTTTVVQTGSTLVQGNVSMGGQFTAEACGFQAGAGVGVSLNGQAVTTLAADANGCVRPTVAVLSEQFVRVAGIRVGGRCGPNALSAVGPGTGGVQVTQTVAFTVVCPAAPRGGVAFTGANIARWGALAVALLGVGALLVLAARRRPAPTRD